MKNKLLKRISLLSFALITTILSVAPVEAEELCTTNKNYYFFIEINYAGSNYRDKISQESGWKRNHRTYFPALEVDKNEIIKEGIICLKRNDDDTESCTSDIDSIDTITLAEYYRLYLEALNNGQSVSYKIDNTEETTKSKVYKTTLSGDIVNNYFTHGKWYAVDPAEDEITGGNGVDLSMINVEDMVNATLLPDLLEITNAHNSSFESLSSTIRRTIKNNKGNDSISTFDVAWSPGGTAQASILSPALYYIEYKVCETITPKYNATINYYYEGTKDRVEFKDDEPNPYLEGGLEDGTTKDIESPALKGCTVDKDKVTIKIEGKDFEENVYYNCDVKENTKTGSALIIAAWIIGIGALGYSVYYFTKLKKEQNAE